MTPNGTAWKPQRIATVGHKYARQWQVPSSSGPKTATYIVSERFDGTYECSCPGWTQHSPRKDCRHIKEVKTGLVAQKNMEALRKASEPPNSLSPFPYLDEVRSVENKHGERGRFYIEKNGDLVCDYCGYVMEASWGCFKCPKCNLTVSEEQYYQLLHEHLEAHGTPEKRYPV